MAKPAAAVNDFLNANRYHSDSNLETVEPLVKLFISVILNEVKNLNRLEILDSSLRSE
jgi:hypothetical protein